ncbi:unnamed protein product [Spirodela intermedia]|uniref:Uncharacterized protein n=1 Tax=Spirodela intermedia TaxID=51605 RepID=A0A7I8J2G4_SPIIN|nr:unnamed protein product [Spirodela intermedia]CAA6663510.1 unnamed protein product [Spirodela intermedia]
MPCGLQSALEELEEKIKEIRHFVPDAEIQAFGSEYARLWLKALKEAVYDADDVLDDYAIAGGMVSVQPEHPPRPACQIEFEHEMGMRIKSINSRLQKISKEKAELHLTRTDDDFSTTGTSFQTSSLVNLEIANSVVELQCKKLLRLLVGNEKDSKLIAITGMGESETTLAKVTFNDQFIAAFHMRWVCRSGTSYSEALQRRRWQHGVIMTRLESVARQVGEQQYHAEDASSWIYIRYSLEDQVWSTSIFPEDEENVLKALYLSYRDLPSSIKQCFLYLSLFPEDYAFARPSVVQYWAAEGFLKPEGTLTMEQIGDKFFDELTGRGLLQPELSAIEGALCKMHDIVRSLCQYLAEGECLFGGMPRLKGRSGKLRRLSMVDCDFPIDLHLLKREQRLRKLLICRNPYGGMVLRQDVIEALGYLRVLDISEEQPHFITKLRHLRYLNVSGTPIGALPDSIGDMKSLEFLLLMNCENVTSLPDGITQLRNLRCLRMNERTNIDQMPRESADCISEFFMELGPLLKLRHLVIRKLERISENKTSMNFTSFEWTFPPVDTSTTDATCKHWAELANSSVSPHPSSSTSSSTAMLAQLLFFEMHPRWLLETTQPHIYLQLPSILEVGSLPAPEILIVRDDSSEDLSPWLEHVCIDPRDEVSFLLLKVRLSLLRRMLQQREADRNDQDGGWNVVKQFPRGHVAATDDETLFFCYLKDQSFFNTNVQVA